MMSTESLIAYFTFQYAVIVKTIVGENHVTLWVEADLK